MYAIRSYYVGLDLPTIAAFCQRGGKVVEIAHAFADDGIGCSTVTAAGMYGDGNDVTELTTRAAEWAVALGADFRITSYNVCYTKLLRVIARGACILVVLGYRERP